ncbi:sigma-70 family RNA polymerase sigma factor [Flavilitoribacter nigricans]|uniref:RNA polymerase subunit sigma n=1 Tax=Flavilitoribacter nigricans (strain ATCC 23147 / DSM 23189 / NBRC 102662 / NCIMB 1420 / SS-2) TaxID=1122177 RepID=A0A2D0N359_FLAN2|nr:RNA polymerase sigma factor RpoD/SigA [Flavilitoribacter nigricans]PHN02183.1 RNA polymerase subunit sigma [Flavilitoribacter nigricans DSM 23189 = NBRC 102662]
MRHLTILPAIPVQASRSLECYFRELSTIPLITAAEEIELSRRIRAGDQAAFEQLVRANLRFVVSVAKQYQNTYIPLMDLISEGNIGLVEAARRFDETKGFKFISYAVWWIRKLIMEAIMEQGRMVRLPAAKFQDLGRINDMINRLEQELERSPTVEELADRLQLEPEAVSEVLPLRSRTISLQAPPDPEREEDWLGRLADQHIPPPDNKLTEVEDRRIEVEQLLANLPKREREILRHCFGIGVDPEGPAELTFETIGATLGLGGERVRLLKRRALLKLRLRC